MQFPKKIITSVMKSVAKNILGIKPQYVAVFMLEREAFRVFTCSELNANIYEDAIAEVNELLKNKSPDTKYCLINFSQFSSGVGR